MKFCSPVRLVVLVLAGIALLSACGSSAESADVPTSSTTTAPASADANATADSSAEVEDERTPEQIAIDELDVSMYQLGVRDLAGVSDCVLARLESEGFSILDDEAAELAALVGCEPAVGSALFGDRSASFGAEPWACATDELAKWVGAIPLAEAQSFFAAPAPPDELITLVADTCGVPESDFQAIFN